MATTMYTLTQAAGTSARKFTVSMWFKPGTISTNRGLWGCGTGTSDAVSMHYQTGDQLSLETWDGSLNPKLRTTRVFRDPAAWYHLVFSIDTTDSDSAERLKIWINGVEETSFITDTTIGENTDIPGWSGSGDTMKIGNRILDGDAFYTGLMSHVHIVDGTIYGASTFGETDSTSGIWKIKTSPTVTYGTNGGFYKFESGALTTDSSGEGNTLTQVGSPTETKDNPSNNFATLNPLIVDGGGATTYSNGNTTATETANQWTSSHSTLAAGASKWYFESEFTLTSSTEGYIGAASVPTINAYSTADFYLGITNASVGYLAVDGTVYNGSGAEAYGDSYTTGDIIGVALDITNGKIYYSKNGTWQNSADPAAGTNGFSLGAGMTSGADICLSVSPNQSYWECNFGNGYFGTTSSGTTEADDAGIGQFKYDVPTGFYALCTKNIKAYGG